MGRITRGKTSTGRLPFGACVLTVVASLAMLTGCERGRSGPADATAPSGVSDNAIAIKWHGNFSETIEPNGEIEQLLERRFQVKIDYVNANNEQLSLMAAANQMPDVVRLPDPGDVTDYAKAGLLLELPESLLAAQTPEIYKAINAIGPHLWGLTSYDGRNYAIPQAVQYVTWDTAMKWRADILKLAGIGEAPRTVADYDNAFRLIETHKPEIIRATNPKLPNLYMFSGTDMASAWNQFTWLFGAYGSMPGTWQLGADGHVARGELLPGTRDALLKLREWYAAGYIDPAFVTDKSEQFADKWEAGEYVVNGASSFISYAEPLKPGEPIKPTDARLLASVPAASFAWEKSPVGPGGDQGVYSWGQRQNFFAVSSRLKDDPEKLAKVLQIIEAVAADEQLWLTASYGIEGQSYRLGQDGNPVFIKPYDDNKSPQTMQMGALGPAASPFAPFAGLAVTNRFADKAVADVWNRLNTERTDAIFGLPLPSSQEMEQLNQDKWTETMVQIITGEKPITYYDDYVQWFHENGGPEWTDEANALYKERFKGK